MRRALLVCLLVLVPVLAGVSGCAWVTPTAAEQVPGDVRAGIVRVLSQRTAAVGSGDRRAFAATTTAGAFRSAQLVWFDNLQRLDTDRFAQRLVAEPVEVDGSWRVRVRTAVRIRGVDRLPVHQSATLTFVATQYGWRVRSLRPEGGVRGGEQQWGSGPISVHRAPGVVVVSESGHEADAQRVVSSAQRAIASVRARVPRAWTGDVLVQAPTGTAALARIGNLPGGVATRLDAVTWRARGGAGGAGFAGHRMVLNPRVLTMAEEDRARVLRHEFTHVALGPAGERIPQWLNEGVAQYVAQQPEPPGRRLISASAVEAARRGVVRLPSDTELREQASAAQYGLAWMACEAIVQRGGEELLWRLVDAMAGRGNRDPDDVLVTVTGLDATQWAGAGAALVRERYR